MAPNLGRYYQLGDCDHMENGDEACKTRPADYVKQSTRRHYIAVAIIALTIVLSNVFTALVMHRAATPRNPLKPGSTSKVQGADDVDRAYPIVEELPTVYTKFKWWTAWGMEAGATNDTDLPSAHVADELWAGILPSHGIIAVNRAWARSRSWPDSMYLPKDEHGREKGVYLLEAYHLMHCLKIIRESFVESQRGLSLTSPVGHTTHCFDALRQSIQCNADNTPLYTFADMTAGDNQPRKCKSWDALRKFATEHSACYRDSDESIPIRDHFGFCEGLKPYQDGRDGLP